ncbi:hypothetical protein ACTXG6_20090 [Pseudonocardia sp. Cha107L01]|uniref:hypothetical protein n=1 Tax=Pseudonocardia sp. Cha107L01 TaxID=3457576 RepID=UPI00403EC613
MLGAVKATAELDCGYYHDRLGVESRLVGGTSRVDVAEPRLADQVHPHRTGRERGPTLGNGQFGDNIVEYDAERSRVEAGWANDLVTGMQRELAVAAVRLHMRRHAMYAVFVEVNADESHLPEARKRLPEVAVPGAREMGARAGYWLAPVDGRGISVVVFDEEEPARKAAGQFQVGQPVGLVEGVMVRTVEVREVLASL